MANFQGSQRKKIFSPRVRAWMAICVLAGFSIVFGRATWNIYQKNHLADVNKQATIRALNELKIRQKEVESKLSKIGTQQGIEEEIRKALPVAKEGEHVITIIDEQKAGNSSADDGEEATSSKAGFWASVFKGR